eukprot:1158313-Pelagomonas_calceolata.AAC.4
MHPAQHPPCSSLHPGAGGMIPSGNGVHGLSQGMSQGGTLGGFAPTSTMVPTQSISGMVPVDSKMPTQQQPSLMNMPPVPGPLNPGGSLCKYSAMHKARK